MNLEICVEYESWNNFNIKHIVTECVEAIFSELKLNHYNVEICFLFTDDDELQTLNKTYRGIDKTTNVLSFPADSIDHNMHDDQCNRETIEDSQSCCCNMCILGSIALAYEIIERETIEQKKKFDDHLRHLIVHSVLHLLGYDHLCESNAEQMENLEIQVLSKLNVPNPYE